MRLLSVVLVLGLSQPAIASPEICNGASLSNEGVVSPFFHFEWVMMPALAKRICSGSYDQDFAAIRRFYSEMHGCSADSEIGTMIEAVLTHEPIEDLFAKFGISDRESVSQDSWNNFCDIAEEIRLDEVLADQAEANANTEVLFAEFVEAIENMQTGER
ncbi:MULTISPECIES: hypothetical protein [unclassified Ruegeria]|uniref:hypothetical protein n=1 Tax=unclassified Ruegeria TaxID=2625375 RepID=UPI001488CDDF|nr:MULTISPECIES: hypothetical protein [unclassified Ruegeria]